jgi:hypothetical protein
MIKGKDKTGPMANPETDTLHLPRLKQGGRWRSLQLSAVLGMDQGLFEEPDRSQ